MPSQTYTYIGIMSGAPYGSSRCWNSGIPPCKRPFTTCEAKGPLTIEFPLLSVMFSKEDMPGAKYSKLTGVAVGTGVALGTSVGMCVDVTRAGAPLVLV